MGSGIEVGEGGEGVKYHYCEPGKRYVMIAQSPPMPLAYWEQSDTPVDADVSYIHVNLEPRTTPDGAQVYAGYCRETDTLYMSQGK